MKIYVNNLHHIVALNTRPEYDTENQLKEIEVSDNFLAPYCDTLIKSFCYHEWVDSEGNNVLSIYPYKDFSLLESIQEQNDIREGQYLETQRTNVNLDFRVSSIELGF